MILAALRNRVMRPDGTLEPWKSPNGLDMAIAAAAPLIPWSDLAYSLTPTGRLLDYRIENPYGTRGGIQKQSWNGLLYGIGQATGFYVPAGMDFAADIQTWNARIEQGEPYDGDPMLEAILDEITSHHSAYYIDDTTPPAPSSSTTRGPTISSRRRGAALLAEDEGQVSRRRDRPPLRRRLRPLAREPRVYRGAGRRPRHTFFARHLKGTGDPLPDLETYTQASTARPWRVRSRRPTGTRCTRRGALHDPAEPALRLRRR
jgi:hypothetical protein